MRKIFVTEQNMKSVVGEIDKIFNLVNFKKQDHYQGFTLSVGDYRRKNLKKPKHLVLTVKEPKNGRNRELVTEIDFEPGFRGGRPVPSEFMIEDNNASFEDSLVVPSISVGDYVLIDNLSIHFILQFIDGRKYYSFVPFQVAS